MSEIISLGKGVSEFWLHGFVWIKMIDANEALQKQAEEIFKDLKVNDRDKKNPKWVLIERDKFEELERKWRRKA